MRSDPAAQDWGKAAEMLSITIPVTPLPSAGQFSGPLTVPLTGIEAGFDVLVPGVLRDAPG